MAADSKPTPGSAALALGVRRRWLHGRPTREGRHAIWLLSPWGLGVAWLVILPAGLAVYWSFTDFNLFNSPRWVGLDNYVNLFHDPVFLKSIRNTLWLAVVGVIAGTAMGLGSAILLQRTNPVTTTLRTVIFLPAVVPPVAAAIIWTFVLNPRYGVLDEALHALGLPRINWLSDPAVAKYGLLIIVLWGAVGQIMITFVAALNEVPRDLREAAALDGAGSFRTFTNVVFPELRPVLLYNVVIATLFYLQFFEQAFVVNPTNLGAPAQSTLTYTIYIYEQAFTFLKMGNAAAMSVILLLVSSLVIGLFFAISRKLER